MPVDITLLYGEMVASWIFHLGTPFIVSIIIQLMPSMPMFKKTLVFLALCVLLSFIIQSAMITVLQANSCGGVKNPKLIFAAAAAGAGITLVLVAIPLFIEPARLVVSQLFGTHKLLNPVPGAVPVALGAPAARTVSLNEYSSTIAQPISQVEASAPPGNAYEEFAARAPVPSAPLGTQVGGAKEEMLNALQYEAQTLKEMMYGSAYWAAFAGAYGIGAGSMIASKCTV